MDRMHAQTFPQREEPGQPVDPHAGLLDAFPRSLGASVGVERISDPQVTPESTANVLAGIDTALRSAMPEVVPVADDSSDMQAEVDRVFGGSKANAAKLAASREASEASARAAMQEPGAGDIAMGVVERVASSDDSGAFGRAKLGLGVGSAEVVAQGYDHAAAMRGSLNRIEAAQQAAEMQWRWDQDQRQMRLAMEQAQGVDTDIDPVTRKKKSKKKSVTGKKSGD